MDTEKFKNWFEVVKETAIEDFGFTESEINHFIEKTWLPFYEKNFAPIEAINEYLGTLFKFQNSGAASPVEKKSKAYYKPLPEYLTIKDSLIHGLGLFATDSIDANFRIGVTHIKDLRFSDGYSRTPLGGFFNHSNNPNCKVVHEGEFIFLETISEIKSGDELTAFYTLYNPTT